MPRKSRPKSFLVLVDGELAGTIGALLRDNPYLDPDEVRALRALAPGESFVGGGGAAAQYVVTRERSAMSACRNRKGQFARCASRNRAFSSNAAGRRKEDPETLAVLDYVDRYARNRGLQARFPRLVVGMMPELDGWPVRDADGGTNIAYFTSETQAEAAIQSARKMFRLKYGNPNI